MSKYIKIIKPWISIISPIVSAILGLLLINIFNFCDYLTFVPKDKKFDVGITVYFGVIEVLLNYFLNFVIDKIMQMKSSLEVIMGPSNSTPDLQLYPIISFKDNENTSFYVILKLCGKAKHFCDAKVIIPDIRFATIQPTIKQQGLRTVNDKIIIDLSCLTGANKLVDVVHRFNFVIQKDLADGTHSEVLFPIIEGKKLVCKHNQIQIVMEE